MIAFLTVGQLREKMRLLPDNAQVVITASDDHLDDLGVESAIAAPLIAWDHDCNDAVGEHRPGQDCPVALGLDLSISTLRSGDRMSAEDARRAGASAFLAPGKPR